jgi:hypothetical protein
LPDITVSYAKSVLITTYTRGLRRSVSFSTTEAVWFWLFGRHLPKLSNALSLLPFYIVATSFFDD